jgi:CDP-glucose 4,6-dehydratase
VESVVSDPLAIWKGRQVLVTGHTGFKGGWLALWLGRLGAQVHGYSLAPPTEPNLFDVARVGSLLASDVRADLADLARLKSAFAAARPDVVFHLAAQPLVREGYRDARGTFATNVMGMSHVLEAARATPSIAALVLITTDKVYENREAPDHAYRESDPLGGHDPYSASKAAAEIVAASYRSSFFHEGGEHAALVATARAGNVIGGADWAADRLVPDCLRAFERGETVRLRYPNSVRPWQHVLEPLSGYLHLAAHLLAANGRTFAGAWNFGPDPESDASVDAVARATARIWGSTARVEHEVGTRHPHEASFLRLDSTRARTQLGWRPRWNLEETLSRTVAWHRAWLSRRDMAEFTTSQIRDYERHP